jgi:hypothetical protein
LIHGDREGLKKGLWATIGLGLVFTAIQAYEYAHAPFGFADNIYTSAFFMATGFHGFHVIVGTIFLIVCLVRAYKGHFTPGSISASRRRPGTGTSSTSSGCSCSSPSTSGAAGAPNFTDRASPPARGRGAGFRGFSRKRGCRA